jgi:hypothetical protein
MVQFLKENASSGLTSVRDATALVKENLHSGRVKQQGWVSEALPIAFKRSTVSIRRIGPGPQLS